MPTVIFINRYFYPDHSATSQLLSDVAFYLANENENIKVVTSRQLYDEAGVNLAPYENIHSVSVKRLWTTRFGRSNLFGRSIDYISFYISAFFVLLKLVKINDFVIAKTDPPMISVIANMVCIFKSAKLINWNQDLFPEVGTELGIKVLEYLKPLILLLRNKALKDAYHNVVIGKTMRDKLLSLGIKNNNISIIPNWSHGEKIYPVAKDENPLRKQWGLEDKFVIGYSGNMGRGHDFETILEIAEKLQHHDDIIFVFIGSGAKKQWLEQEVKARSLPNIIFKAYQPRENLTLSLSVPDIHVISLFPKLEGLIVPSKYYGVAAAGRACLFIGDKNGEIPRILKANKCGSAINLGDTQTGVDYILEMKSSQEKCQQQGERARSIFLEKFDYNIALKKWKRLLHS